MIFDVIYSLLVLIEKLAVFNKQSSGFMISLSHSKFLLRSSLQMNFEFLS